MPAIISGTFFMKEEQVRLESKCLPVGSLPYNDEKLATQMMVRLFEDIPYLPIVPVISATDTIISRTINNLPWFSIKNKKIIIKDGSEKFNQDMIILDKAYNEPTQDIIEAYKIESPFLTKFLQILNRIKPKTAVVNLLGPFTISQMISKAECPQILIDKLYRKVVIQSVCVKALWIANKIKEVSPETTPLIIFEEPMLHKFGCMKRSTEELTNDIIENMYSKVFQKLHQNGCLVGVQCFEKCDWQLVLSSGVDLISFDAYNNPNNIGIIADKINSYLAAGGYINWGIVPVKTEALIKSLTIDNLQNRFKKTVEGIANQGVNINLLYRRSLVSIQGNIDKLPIIFAEKALILSTQLAKKIPLTAQQ